MPTRSVCISSATKRGAGTSRPVEARLRQGAIEADSQLTQREGRVSWLSRLRSGGRWRQHPHRDRAVGPDAVPQLAAAVGTPAVDSAGHQHGAGAAVLVAYHALYLDQRPLRPEARNDL